MTVHRSRRKQESCFLLRWTVIHRTGGHHHGRRPHRTKQAYVKTPLEPALLLRDLEILLVQKIAEVKWKKQVERTGRKMAPGSTVIPGRVLFPNAKEPNIWLKPRPDLESIYGYLGGRRGPEGGDGRVYQVFTRFIVFLHVLVEALGPYTTSNNCSNTRTPLQLFEAHIPFNLHFLEQARVVGMGWLKVVNGKIRHKKSTTVEMEVETSFRDCFGRNNEADSVTGDDNVELGAIRIPPGSRCWEGGGAAAAGAAPPIAAGSAPPPRAGRDPGEFDSISDSAFGRGRASSSAGLPDLRILSLENADFYDERSSADASNESIEGANESIEVENGSRAKAPLMASSGPRSGPSALKDLMLNSVNTNSSSCSGGAAAAAPKNSQVVKTSIERKHWVVKALKGLWVQEARRCRKNGLALPEPASPAARQVGSVRESPVLEAAQQVEVRCWTDCLCGVGEKHVYVVLCRGTRGVRVCLGRGPIDIAKGFV